MSPHSLYWPAWQVDLKEILSTGRFDMATAQRSAGWLQSLIADGPLIPESEEYGMSSFIYRCPLEAMPRTRFRQRTAYAENTAFHKGGRGVISPFQLLFPEGVPLSGGHAAAVLPQLLLAI